MMNITPQQMRELAAAVVTIAPTDEELEEAAAALRTAADQLEAVQARVRDYYYENGFTESAADHLIAFLAADTGHKEDRDE